MCGLYFRAVAPTATNALSHDCLGCASCRQIATDSGLLVAQLGERRLESSLGQRKGGRRFCLPFGWSHHRPRLNVTLRRTTSEHFSSVAENNTGILGATLTLCSPSVYGRRRLCWWRHPSVKRHCVDLNFDVFRKSSCGKLTVYFLNHAPPVQAPIHLNRREASFKGFPPILQSSGREARGF